MVESSPIFSKTYNLLLWTYQHTAKFPKNERFRLAQQVDQSLLDFQSCLFEPVYLGQTLERFQRADLALARLRTFGRMSHDMAFSSMSQYEYFANQVTEIGKLLGGWRKSAFQ